MQIIHYNILRMCNDTSIIYITDCGFRVIEKYLVLQLQLLRYVLSYIYRYWMCNDTNIVYITDCGFRVIDKYLVLQVHLLRNILSYRYSWFNKKGGIFISFSVSTIAIKAFVLTGSIWHIALLLLVCVYCMCRDILM